MYDKKKINEVTERYLEKQTIENEKEFFKELELFAKIVLKKAFRHFNLRQHSDDIIQEFFLSVWNVIQNNLESIKKAHQKGISYTNIWRKDLQDIVYRYAAEIHRIAENEVSYGLLEDLTYKELMGLWDDDEELVIPKNNDEE